MHDNQENIEVLVGKETDENCNEKKVMAVKKKEDNHRRKEQHWRRSTVTKIAETK